MHDCRDESAEAHPRSRGENIDGSAATICGAGSSPLTRGKPPIVAADLPKSGLIPAHAGKTWWLVRGCRGRGAHPRSRGENNAILLGLQSDPGSSPLTRGKRERAALNGYRKRLIPAHAGKTESAMRGRPWAVAHPRSRGENVTTVTKARAVEGSSPLTRGKRVSGSGSVSSPRLIPAHAGKTPDCAVHPVRSWAHPRSRGENLSRDAHSSEPTGSSPLTRGKLWPGWLLAVV